MVKKLETLDFTEFVDIRGIGKVTKMTTLQENKFQA